MYFLTALFLSHSAKFLGRFDYSIPTNIGIGSYESVKAPTETCLWSSRSRHGAFIKALIEAIQQNKADYNKNGVIEIKELDLFVTMRVKELTRGTQHPTTEIPITLPNFPVAIK